MDSHRSYIDHLLVNGKRLEIDRHGASPEDAPTLVFLHEGLGCLGLWGDFPSKLAAATGCGALVYSRLGYGKSDASILPRPIRYMHDEGLEVLPQLLEVAGIRDCILIGHSDGGSIAIIYAGGTEAIPLRGLITEAAHVFCEDICLRAVRLARKMYLNGVLRRKLKKHHGDNTDNAFWGWSDAWRHPDFRNWNIEEYLSGVKVPMLVIQGENDNQGTPAQVEAISRQVTTLVDAVMLPDCGHAPHKEQEAVVFKAMMDYIARLLG
jgi:pimeloyl-ACP methyl ester carboxylesterase